VVPITIRQHFWGFIGFDNCQTERQWSEEEESILLAMAGSIGGAIACQQAEEE
jgi:two-component system sensor histidine kinase/response regulator